MTTLTQTDRKAEFIAATRAVADLLEATPDLRTPDAVSNDPMTRMPRFNWCVWDAEPAAKIAQLVRLIGGKWDKNTPDDAYDRQYYVLAREYHGATLEIHAYRDSVCERVVTGTRTVEQVIATAHETVTVTEDIVEWRCHPVLAGAGA